MQAKELFIEADEREIQSITSGSVGVGFDLKKEYCVLSNKRLYHKGVSYNPGAGVSRATRQDVLELADINGTSIATIGNMKLLILGIALLVVLIGIFPLISYFCSRIRCLYIHGPGGTMAMEFKWCKMQTLIDFEKQLHIAADNARKERARMLAAD